MINNNTDGVAVVHGVPIVASIGPNDKPDQGTGPIYLKTSYINNLPTPVVVVERNGLRHTVRNASNNYNQNFIIRTEIVVRQEAYNDIERVIACLDENSNSDLKVIKETYYLHRNNKMYHGMTIVIDHPITMESIKEKDGSLYYKNKDVVISTLPLLDAPSHPYSDGVISTKDFEGFNDEHNVNIRFEIIDSNETLSNRYICIAKQVYKILPKKDGQRRDGIYVTTTERDISTASKRKLVQTRYDFEGCEKTLGIYKTSEEAFSSGDNGLARKEELAKQEHEYKLELQKGSVRKLELEQILLERTNELALLRSTSEHEIREYTSRLERESHERAIEQSEQKAELARYKHESEIKEHKAKMDEIDRQRSLQREIDRITLENKHLEAQMEREKSFMKDFYETKSYARKDNSEITKYLPSLIVATGAIFMAFMKITAAAK